MLFISPAATSVRILTFVIIHMHISDVNSLEDLNCDEQGQSFTTMFYTSGQNMSVNIWLVMVLFAFVTIKPSENEKVCQMARL